MADPEKPVTFQSADGRFSVSLLGNVVEKMVRFCSAAHDLETGGILIGRYSDNRAVAIVEQVTGPPPDSHHYFARFLRGVVGLQELLNRLWRKKEKKYYLGEWHYHSLSIPTPSDDDIAQMNHIAASEKYACPEPILLIVAGLPSTEWNFSATVHPLNKPMVMMSQALAS